MKDEPLPLVQKVPRERFTELGAKMLSVSKEEIEKREIEWRRTRKRRSKRK